MGKAAVFDSEPNCLHENGKLLGTDAELGDSKKTYSASREMSSMKISVALHACDRVRTKVDG